MERSRSYQLCSKRHMVSERLTKFAIRISLKFKILRLTSQTRNFDEALVVFDDHESKYITKYHRYVQRVGILRDNGWTEFDNIGIELTTITRLKVPVPLFHLQAQWSALLIPGNKSGHPPDRFKFIEIPQVVDEECKELREREGYVRNPRRKKKGSVQRRSIRSKQDNFQVICATCWALKQRSSRWSKRVAECGTVPTPIFSDFGASHPSSHPLNYPWFGPGHFLGSGRTLDLHLMFGISFYTFTPCAEGIFIKVWAKLRKSPPQPAYNIAETNRYSYALQKLVFDTRRNDLAITPQFVASAMLSSADVTVSMKPHASLHSSSSFIWQRNRLSMWALPASASQRTSAVPQEKSLPFPEHNCKRGTMWRAPKLVFRHIYYHLRTQKPRIVQLWKAPSSS